MYVQEGRERLFLEVQDLFQNMVASDAYEIADMDIDMLEHAISRWMKQYPTISVMVFQFPVREHQGKAEGYGLCNLPITGAVCKTAQYLSDACAYRK